MSLNDYQQSRVNLLLATDFKIQYDTIPNEFKRNYWFEYFLWNMAYIYWNTKFRAEIKEELGIDTGPDPRVTQQFNLSEIEGVLSTAVEYSYNGIDRTDKKFMEMTLEKDGTLYFRWIFSYMPSEKYSPETDDICYELKMELSEDKKSVSVKHTRAFKKDKPCKSYMDSVFDTSINEISRTCEAIDVETNAVLYHEEFEPVGAIDPSILTEWHKQAERTPIQLLGISDNINQTKHNEKTRRIFVGKCTIGENTRYAVCWKPTNYVDKAYQESFQSIVEFSSPFSHLSHQLDLDEEHWLIEIPEEEYNRLKEASGEGPQ